MKFDKLIDSPVVELVFMAGLIIMYTLLNVAIVHALLNAATLGNIQWGNKMIIASALTLFTFGFITVLFERELYSDLKEKILSSAKEDR